MKKRVSVFVSSVFSIAALGIIGFGQYKTPPKDIVDILNAPAIPNTSISPTRDKLH